jgi:pseudaminic acid cytidylyltransferase
MNIAIIQARGGSKRIPGKNIKNFLGEPIINYSVKAALSCGDIFDKVIVTTDSEKIAKIAENAGAEIPFMRPAKLADDYTSTWEVVEHAVKECEDKYSAKIANVCCLYATAPFLRSCDIRKGYELLTSQKVSSAFSVTSFPFPIFRGMKIEKDGHLEMFWPEHELSRSNDLPEAYHDAGQFYWLDAQKFLVEKKMYGKDALPVILPRILVQDIDTPEDWETAEILYQICKKRGLL